MWPAKTRSVHFASATNNQSEERFWPGNTFLKSFNPTQPYPLFEYFLLLFCLLFQGHLGVRLYKHRHGIHITVGNVMLDVIYVAVVDYGFKRPEMPNLPSAAMVYPAVDYRLTLLLARPSVHCRIVIIYWLTIWLFVYLFDV